MNFDFIYELTIGFFINNIGGFIEWVIIMLFWSVVFFGPVYSFYYFKEKFRNK